MTKQKLALTAGGAGEEGKPFVVQDKRRRPHNGLLLIGQIRTAASASRSARL
jgi:hypothetical protein